MDYTIDFLKANYVLAKRIATKAFEGKTDKGGDPYINHALRVDIGVDKETTLDECTKWRCKIAALLHDVVEDTDVTLEDLKSKGFDDDVIEAVDLLTRQYGVSYISYVCNIEKNEIARIVKIHDLEDNCNIMRLPKFGHYEQARLKKYFESWCYLKRFTSEATYRDELSGVKY